MTFSETFYNLLTHFGVLIVAAIVVIGVLVIAFWLLPE